MHALTSTNIIFQWRVPQQKAFNILKEKLSTTLVLTLPNLLKPFKIEIDASGFAMGVVLMQGGMSVCYHSKNFIVVVGNYPNYDKELYALVQSVKKMEAISNGQRNNHPH